ncbi:MAG: ligase-associated DNA damage response endonuclease PdeM [Gemmatimonadaceae bacterium]|nr:ligase-associated DNA damage response endonuclease PdeM [Acetobacteraceae bacterium]
MTAAPLHFRGERLLLDPMGAVVWPAAGVLAVADLHLEKGSACAVQGHLVPPWDTRLTLDRLILLMRRWRPQIVVALGDSFHDAHGSVRMGAGDAARLRACTDATEFVWVLGNHDPVPPSGLGGIATNVWMQGPLTFRHQAQPGTAGELCGHHHPKASVTTRAGTVTRPCFVADARRLMLPALGAYTGGLDLAHPAIAGLFPRGGRAWLLGQDRLFSFTLAQVTAGAPARTALAAR